MEIFLETGEALPLATQVYPLLSLYLKEERKPACFTAYRVDMREKAALA